jgi:hypothetical protein
MKKTAFKLILVLSLNFTINCTFAQVNFAWVKQVGSADYEYAYDIAVDAAGNSYATGSFEGTVDFDPGPGITNLVSGTSNATFISKLDASGNLVWAKQFEGTGFSSAQAIVLDNDGNIYTTGKFTGLIDFDPGPGVFNSSASSNDKIFVTKLNAAGNFVWAKYYTCNDYCIGTRIALDDTGNVYFAGMFQGGLTFSASPNNFGLNSVGEEDIYIAKIDSSGTFVWAKKLGGLLGEIVNGIAIDSLGNVYTSGTFRVTADFDPGTSVFNLTSVGLADVFVSKLNNQGEFVWAKSVGSTSNEYVNDFAIDNAGNVYTTGSFQGVVDFNPGTPTQNFTSFGSSDAFILKLDADGNYVWNRRLGGTDYQQSYAIALDAANDVYTLGVFSGTVNFNPLGSPVNNITCTGSRNMYMSKISAAGNFVWAQTFVGDNFDFASSIAIDASNNIYSLGSLTGTTDFDPGVGIFNLTTVGNWDIFIHKLSPAVATNIANIAQHNFNVYPNPTNGELSLVLNEESIITITDASGSTIKTQVCQAGKNQISLSDLCDGLYFVQIKDRNQTQFAKIVVQK